MSEDRPPWPQVDLGSLLTGIEAGRSFLCDSRVPGPDDVGVVKVSAVTWGTYDEDESKTCTNADMVQPAYFVRQGDFLFSRANTVDLVGACVIAGRTTRRIMLSDKILRFRFVEPVDRWVLYFLRSPRGRAEIEAAATGNQESMRNIGQGRIRRIRLPLPRAAIRNRVISAIETQFTRLDSAVATLERVKANLKRARASVLKAAVEGRLLPTEASLARAEGRPYESASVFLARILEERKVRLPKGKKYVPPVEPEAGGLPRLPEGWAWASVDQLCAEVTDGDHQPPPVSPTGVPFLVIGDVRTGILDFTDCRRVSDAYYADLDWKKRPDSSDLLYTVTGSFGIPVRVVDDRPFCVQRHIAILKAPPSDIKGYLLWALSSGSVFQQASKKATGTAQKTVGLASLRSIVVPLPPVSEAARVASEVERRLSLLDKLVATVDLNFIRCTRLRQSILKRAFEGKLVLQNPDDEPANVLLDRIQSQVSSVV